MGEEATIDGLGSPNDDVIEGTNGDDVIVGLGGFDEINGGRGDDIICGEADGMGATGSGDDIEGGRGRDQLAGNTGDDEIGGGQGNDLILLAGEDLETFDDEFTVNKASGGGGDDSIRSEDGNDTMFGDSGSDFIGGGEGDDEIRGGDDNDRMDDPTLIALEGGPGEDDIYGGNGLDDIDGGDDNDVLEGQGKKDFIVGGTGIDAIIAGGGNDIVEGGDEDPDDPDLPQGVRSGDTILGNDGNDKLNGEGGEDEIRGGANDDVIRGGADNDLLFGDDDQDELFGEGGIDQLNGGRPNGGNKDDTCDGGGQDGDTEVSCSEPESDPNAIDLSFAPITGGPPGKFQTVYEGPYTYTVRALNYEGDDAAENVQVAIDLEVEFATPPTTCSDPPEVLNFGDVLPGETAVEEFVVTCTIDHPSFNEDNVLSFSAIGIENEDVIDINDVFLQVGIVNESAPEP